MARGGAADLDYARLFAAAPDACVVLDLELRILSANDAYLRVTGRSPAELLGRGFFEVYPQDSTEGAAHDADRQRASLELALTGERDTLLMHRFAIPPADRTGEPEVRWWNVVNVPVFGRDGRVESVIHRVDDVTDFVLVEGAPSAEAPALEPDAQLVIRARELQRAIRELRERAARTHDVALTLQSAMLSTPDLAHHPEIAVRYQPADQELNACGDWYDVVDLGEDKVALSVGDVVGHGVQAASVMGMLRSAYSAAVRIADGPNGALEALGLYARAHEAALAS
ncbi:MAG TPA: PAS domain-containing protein, partial [Actinospica sp.]|nr:PAS domain-containing protein [Actinospica sp.]